MGTLTHKTTILLSPTEHRFLQQEARKQRLTMGEIIRRAIRTLYCVSPQTKTRKAWGKLFRARAPVADWEAMEAEILKGRLER